MAKLPKPSTLWEGEGEKWFELEDNLEEGKFDFLEYKEEPPPKGIILQRDVSVAMGPEPWRFLQDMGSFYPPRIRVKSIWQGQMLNGISGRNIFILSMPPPSGSYQPSLTFGPKMVGTGWQLPLSQREEEIPEVWIIEPPYSERWYSEVRPR